MDEICLIIGGPQGSGLETSMSILGYAFARKGYWFIADREYFSNITGRHSYIHLCVSTLPVSSLRYPVDILAAADAETIFTHFDELSIGGVLIYDKGVLGKKLEDIPSIEDTTRERIAGKIKELGIQPTVSSIVNHLESSMSVKAVGVDYQVLLRGLAAKYTIDPKLLSRYVSGIIVAMISLVLGLRKEVSQDAVSRFFRGRPIIAEQNNALIDSIYEMYSELAGIVSLDTPTARPGKLMVVTGNDIVAIGKIVAGVRLQSYYPITPAADESFLLEKYQVIEADEGVIGPIIVFQTEDEIAAVSSIIGASLTGARSSTSTSGPGFDLMVEGLSYAGMNEAPIVITYYQRGGPSTGQPTRGSQSDLLNAVFAGHGEFARVVLSSGDHVEAFYDAIDAFNIAEKYQVPVIHILDKFLANSLVTITPPDPGRAEIERGLLSSGGPNYKRFDSSKLISPRAFLGAKDTVMWYSGDEHNEYGHIEEDPVNRIKMYSKRIEKLELIRKELPLEKKITLQGHDNPDFILVGWGSTKGVSLDAIRALGKEGMRGAYVNLKLLWPFPGEEFRSILERFDKEKIIFVEHSYGVSLRHLVAMSTGLIIEKNIAKFTGRPLTREEVVAGVKKIIMGETLRVVAFHGA
ncbi:2-oxoacid:ferredoxin oxidoreductase subunit alpha [Infirmifilum sp.]|uniref:2-oxoacid:ferredoxin oxidoreductase subunit alpha n=1 Tax=Infirmifilum sp. TaxID=2856575 RepID=UPI003D0FB11E